MDRAAQTIQGENLNHTAFPLGGLGAGMVCLEGNGALNHLSIRHRPELYHDPNIFATLHVKGDTPVTRVLEGPVQNWKVFGPVKGDGGLGNGAGGHSYGLPRFRETVFRGRFPFAEVELIDPSVPVRAAVTGWSPFVPADTEASCLPVAALEYTFINTTDAPLEVVFAVHSFQMVRSFNFRDADSRILPAPHGFTVTGADKNDEEHTRFNLAVTIPDDGALVDHAWFRGGWFDPLTMMWKNVSTGQMTDNPPRENAPGASVQIALKLAPGAAVTVPVLLAWHTPGSDLRVGHQECTGDGCCGNAAEEKKETYRPWYAERFKDINDVTAYWQSGYGALLERTRRFADTLQAATLPAEVMDAVTANLSILKSPTVMRQFDGRLWVWEGCCDGRGCCHGSCTHVWNYAQALPHLFPALERTLRETELDECQDDKGHQNFRAPLPIGRPGHDFHAAADGQLGGIIKMYREWRVSGNDGWLDTYWNKIAQSMDYCISTWDPRGKGVLEEPHHNTYDIEFWGPDGMCSSIYVNALDALVRIGTALSKDTARYADLRDKGKAYLESELFNGEYFIQHIVWKGLDAPAPDDPDVPGIMKNYSDEAKALLQKEGPKYQYGTGCLSDGVIGEYFAACAGLPGVLDKEKVKSHLLSVFKYNFRKDLTGHVNPQRPGYAMEGEGGLLLCTWPKGGALSLPFVYSNEVWTGFEYQVAAHLMLAGCTAEGLEIVRTARSRHDGRVRNPYNEYECGHWYGRALSSYALLQGLSGLRYDAVEKILYVKPTVKGDFTSFLSTATGYGTTGIRDGKPFVDVVSGTIEMERIIT